MGKWAGRSVGKGVAVGHQCHLGIRALSCIWGTDTIKLLLNQSLLIWLSRLKESTGNDNTIKNNGTALLLKRSSMQSNEFNNYCRMDRLEL